MHFLPSLSFLRIFVRPREVDMSHFPQGKYIAPSKARHIAFAVRENIALSEAKYIAFHIDLISNTPGVDHSRERSIRLDLLHDEGLENIADLDIIELFKSDTAFVALCHFLGVVLEALERGDLILENDHAVTKDADL